MRVACLLVGLLLSAVCGCGAEATKSEGGGTQKAPTPPPAPVKPPQAKEEPIEKVAPMPREAKR